MVSDIEALIQTLQEAELALTALEAFAPSSRKFKCAFIFQRAFSYINFAYFLGGLPSPAPPLSSTDFTKRSPSKVDAPAGLLSAQPFLI